MAARYRPAALHMPGRRGEAFCRPVAAVDGFLEPAHTAKLQVESEDGAHRLGLGRIDDQLALLRVIAERRVAAHPHALLLRGGDLVADALAGDLTLELGKGNRTLRVSRPIELVVLNCWVTETN